MIDKTRCTEKHNLLLSLSVFKKLYDENKDIYEIISLFIKHELSNLGLNKFSLLKITQKINEGYNFNIPQAIVKTSLNKIKKEGGLKLKQGEYTKLKNFESIAVFDSDSNLAGEEERYITMTFKNNIKEKTLSDDEIRKSLESYILNKNDTHNIFHYIDSCIIENSSDSRFIKGLNEIKYGLILYEGISYGIESINPNNWNEKTIFLDTEILFYLGSYSGVLFEEMTNDFISLIEITNKTKKVVALKFSADVKKEVDSLFNVAESILKKDKAYKPNEVVENILESCSSASDVVSKKSDFYLLLSKLGIKEYENTIDYSKESHQYNLEVGSGLDEKTQHHIKQLSSINILRKGAKYNTLDKVQYLLLTETRNTIDLSTQHKDVNDFPLALSLFDLTNQLWIKTNKGLGSSNLPSTLDIRNKAKIALSSSLAKKISEEYDKTNNDHKNNNVDVNALIDKISDLRKINSNPDNINESNCKAITDLILDPSSMERHYLEKDMYKQESKNKSSVISAQNDDLKEKDNVISNFKKQEERRKCRNKKNLQGCGCLLIVFLLFYFSGYLIQFIGKFIYVAEGLASILSISLFVGIDGSKIKSWWKKK